MLPLQKKTTSDLSLRTIRRQYLLAFGHVSDPLVFLCLVNALYSLSASSFGWLGTGSRPEHTASLWAWPTRAGQEWILCWITNVQALVPTDNSWILSYQLWRGAHLHREDKKRKKADGFQLFFFQAKAFTYCLKRSLVWGAPTGWEYSSASGWDALACWLLFDLSSTSSFPYHACLHKCLHNNCIDLSVLEYAVLPPATGHLHTPFLLPKTS